MEIQNRLCKLCLVKCDNFKFIEENTKDLLDIVLKTTELTVIQESVMCKKCEETLKNCFDFKAKCLYTYNYLIPFVNKESASLNLKDVYLSKNDTASDVSEDQDVCGFCMNLVKYRFAVSVDVEETDVLLKKMIEQCLPELDLNIIKKPVICTHCHRSLENCFRFVTNCLTAEENIKKRSGSLDEYTKGQIELSSLLHSTMETEETSYVDGDLVDVKAEMDLAVKIENSEESEIVGACELIKLEQMSCDDREKVSDFENKNQSFMSSDNQKVNNEHQFTPKNTSVCIEEDNILGIVKIEETFCAENETIPEAGNIAEMDDQKFIRNKEIDIKTDDHDFNRIEENVIGTDMMVNIKSNGRQKRMTSHSEGELLKSHFKKPLMKKDMKITKHQCEGELFDKKNKKCVSRPLQICNESSEVTMFKCEICSYQARRKYTLKIHMLQHLKPELTMFTCEFCSYQTKYKRYLKQHLKTHNITSEMPLFKCNSCPFQAKLKGNLKQHMLQHMEHSEVTMFACEFCPHQTKYKNDLKLHSRIHKSTSEITMFKCDSCPFEARQKGNLKTHMLKHTKPSETTMFKCESCPFETKWGDSIKRHVLKHLEPSIVTMFTCDLCSYHTTHKYNFKQHLTTHKSTLEITMFKCDICPFETRQKGGLKRHIMLKHVDPSEVTMFPCDICSHQFKNKRNLELHLRIHKSASELTMFKCDYCPFHSKYKYSLKNHMVKHTKASEVTMFKCESCSFQTKWRDSFRRHTLQHMKPSEVMLFTCDFCSYRSKYKGDVIRHLITHKAVQK